MAPQAYRVFPAVFAPGIFSVAAVAAGVSVSWWWLAALPFIWLGAVCAAPNLNLVNGCLAHVATVVGLGLATRFAPLGLAIVVGTLAGYYAGALEKFLRMRPIAGSD